MKMNSFSLFLSLFACEAVCLDPPLFVCLRVLLFFCFFLLHVSVSCAEYRVPCICDRIHQIDRSVDRSRSALHRFTASDIYRFFFFSRSHSLRHVTSRHITFHLITLNHPPTNHPNNVCVCPPNRFVSTRFVSSRSLLSALCSLLSALCMWYLLCSRSLSARRLFCPL